LGTLRGGELDELRVSLDAADCRRHRCQLDPAHHSRLWFPDAGEVKIFPLDEAAKAREWIVAADAG
jgi:hypothetical protein